MKAKVIHTTDSNYLWNIYEVDSPDLESIQNATWNKFAFDMVTITKDKIKLQNSNYTAILKILP